MGERKYIKETSPYIQEYIVNLARDYYRAIKSGDIYSAVLALQFIYDTMPEEVKNEVDNRLQGFGIESFDQIRQYIEENCKMKLLQYGQKTSTKLAVCIEESKDLLMSVYSLLMESAYRYNLFFSIKSIEVGVME